MIDAESELKRGLLWFGSATLITRLIDLGATLALLLLLTREQMGLAALSWSVAVVLEAWSGLGTGAALVQAQDVDERETHSLFWFSTLLGVVLALLAVLAAPLLGAWYQQPELTSMVAFSSLKLVLVGMSVVPLQLLARALRFRLSGAVQTVATLGEALCKVCLALLGFGAWSLVISNVARGAVLLLALVVVGAYHPRVVFEFGKVRRFVRFGLPVTFSSILYHCYRNMDYFLIGKFLGMEVLGVYRVAFDIAMQPLELILNVVGRVSFPIYSRVAQHKDVLAKAFLQSIRSLLLLATPISVLLVFLVPDLLPLIGERRWVDAIAAAQILCWASLWRGMTQLFPQLFQAVGRPFLSVLDSLLTLVVLTAGFWSALSWYPSLGALPVCYAWLVVYPGLALVLVAMARTVAPLTWFGMWQAVWPGVLGALTLSLSLLAVREIALDGFGPTGRLAQIFVAGAAVYFLYLRIVLRISWHDLRPRAALETPALDVGA